MVKRSTNKSKMQKGPKGQNGGKGQYLQSSQIIRESFRNIKFLNFSSLLGHSPLGGGLAFLTFQLS